MIEAVLLNIVAQAVWELGLSPLLRGTDRPATQDADSEAGKTRYASSVQSAVEQLQALSNGGISQENLTAFLSTTDVRNLVTSLFVFRLDQEEIGLGEAQTEFMSLWTRNHMGSDEDGTLAFKALVTAAEDSLGAAIRDGVLSAHEARASARHQMTIEYLKAMERRIVLSVEGSEIPVDQIDQFEEALRREVRNRHATITPPDFYGAARVPIDDLYVMPNLRRTTAEGQHPSGLPVNDWLAVLQYGVVLGDPGGGKSTLAAKLCHTLSEPSAWPADRFAQLPVMVTLREYSATRKARGLSISEYIEDVAAVRYQLDVPAGAVDYLLLAGRLLVIFDGLDELLETHHRQQIRDDVESFQRRFPSARILVTSRAVGYEQAPLDSQVFQVVHLAEFTDEQVEEYAHKWFCLEESLSAKEQAAKAGSFIDESRAVPDLRTNPLLLALMCNFYLGQNYLPRHLPEVYETCAKMLFETWDRSRGIDPVLPIAEHIRPAMRYLALWIYENEDLQGGASEQELVGKAVEFLLQFRFDDEYEARNAAETFIEFCAGRAWVFTDTGTTAEGEKLFQFTHRTFLEYFAADHLVASAETTEQLSEVLTPHIALREWWVVAQVAYQLKSKSTLTAADQLLRDLIERSVSTAPSEQGNLVLFGVECLSFLVPSPPIVRTLATEAARYLVSNVAADSDADSQPAVTGIAHALAKVGHETRKAFAGTVIATFVEMMGGPDDRAVAAGLCLGELDRGTLSPEAMIVWSELIQDARKETLERRRSLAGGSRALATSLAWDGDLSVRELVEHHGSSALFLTRSASLEERAFFAPLLAHMGQWAFRSGIWGEGETEADRWEAMLGEASAVLLEVEPPWVGYVGFFPAALDPEFGPEADEYSEPSAESLFGLALVLAVYLERRLRENVEDEQAAHRIRADIERSNHPFVQSIASVLLRRLGEESNADLANAALAESPFDEPRKKFLAEWMEQSISLVGPNNEEGEGPDIPPF